MGFQKILNTFANKSTCMFTKLLSAIIIAAVLVSCSANDKKADAAATGVAPMPQHQDSTATAKKDPFTDVKFDSEKDFVCGMPVSAGIEDTAHYKGKVYGFCSKDCKAEFAKTPDAFLAKK
jgi:YHS domain-containing protein